LNVPLDQQVEIALDVAPFGLKQRPVCNFVTFGAVFRALNFKQEADINRKPACFCQLKLVFPFPGIE
jgi:hypothetical protein